MRKYYQLYGEVTSSHTVNYSFVCEHCGKDSGTLTKDIKRGSVINVHNVSVESDGYGTRVSQDSLDLHKSIAGDRVSEATKVLYRQVKRRAYPGFRDKCPHCGKHQSWGNCCLNLYGGEGVLGSIILTLFLAIVWMIVITLAGFFAIAGYGLTVEPYANNAFSVGINSLLPGVSVTFKKYMLWSYIMGLFVTPLISLIGIIIHRLRVGRVREKHFPAIKWNITEFDE